MAAGHWIAGHDLVRQANEEAFGGLPDPEPLERDMLWDLPEDAWERLWEVFEDRLTKPHYRPPRVGGMAT